MSILGRYVTSGFLLQFVAALAVFSLVMAIGSIVRAIDLVARGASAAILARFLLLNIPYILQYTIPMSVMTATLLHFTRLSLDGEIIAMKACGMSLWQIVAPVVAVSVAVSAATLWVTNWVSPSSRFAQRRLVVELAGEDPFNLIEPGLWIRDFPGLMVFASDKQNNRLANVVIHRLDGQTLRATIRAREGVLRPHPDDPTKMLLDLYTVRMEEPDRRDPSNPLKTRVMVAEYNLQEIDVSRLRRQASIRKKTSDLTWPELDAAIRAGAAAMGGPTAPRDAVGLAQDQMRLLVELNGRLAMSFACSALTLVGIPLGMRSRRRESSIGVFVSLLVVFCFYFFLMIARSMTDRPRLHPDLVVWFPVLAAQIGGVWMIHRST